MNAPAATLAALLTPLAPGAIAVVGLYGPGVDAVLDAVLRRRYDDAAPDLKPDRPTLCRLVDGDEVVDEVVVCRFVESGQPAAEICTHGGVRVVERALAAVRRAGARCVEAAAVVERSPHADRVVRDVDAALLRSGSRRMTQWLLAQRRLLPTFLTQAPRLPADERAAYVARTQVAIRLVAGIRVAIVGLPSAGKSTLANRLIGSDRLITSTQPGTTRDWVAETALVCGWPVTLTDTPGIRPTDCAIEAEAIRRGSAEARAADLAVVVLDGVAGATQVRADLATVVDRLPPDQPRIAAVNKCDLLPERLQKELLRAVMHDAAVRPSAGACAVSALKGTGIERLESAVTRSLGLDRLDTTRATGFLAGHLIG